MREALTLYRKHILVAGALGFVSGVVFGIVASQIALDSRSASILTLFGLAANAALLLAVSRVMPPLFPTRGTLLESLLAQILLFLSAWTAVYNLLP
ncbi:MAG: hypothetical protein NZ902_01655 [Acidilobaceae archaeon]|nr:hypothetical protein [Acidilobaceae archaeon]MCX8165530.1 hypothetical protein [Acidilobaceae archaeon]MDW7973957.1 hypothetical protein [Sulfolobales archaeon]